MRAKITYTLNSGDKTEIYGVTLLKRLDEAAYQAVQASSSCEEKKYQGKKLFRIDAPSHWLDVAYRLRENAKKNSFSACYVRVNKQTRVKINHAFDRKVSFSAEIGGTYQAITQKIQAILADSDISDSDLARALLNRFMLQGYPAKLQAHREFLDCLLVLMICVEGSRHYPALAYNLMLLDLIICGGDEKTHYSWANAFISGKGYQWDDSEAKNFGGKYPLAVNSTGPRNFSDYVKLARSHSSVELQKLAEVKELLQHRAVEVRGMTLIVHWLYALQGSTDDYIFEADNTDQVPSKLQHLFRARIDRGYVDDDAKPGVPTILLKQNATPRPPNATDLVDMATIDAQYCFFLTHMKNGVDHRVSRFFHRVHAVCKLVPEYVLAAEQKTVKAAEGKYTAKAKVAIRTVSTARNADGLNKQPCPHCYQVGKPEANEDEPVITVTYANSPDTLHWYKGGCDTKVADLGERKLPFFRKAKSDGKQECQDCWPGVAAIEQGVVGLNAN